MNHYVVVKLNREEALACAIALAKEKKPYKWQQNALTKVDSARSAENGYYHNTEPDKS